MLISDVRNKYLELKKTILKLAPQTDFKEYDTFINSLKKFEKYEIELFAQMMKQIDISELTDRKKKKVKLTLEEILKENGVSSFSFSEAEISKLEEFEHKDILSKQHLISLANQIGITKKVFKTKQEIYQEIKRFIVNRDILLNIEKVIKQDEV
ncbi:hypothetical protein [Paenibacillus sp. CGMCC 1.18879]|uniref:hypothetical protein n=1 Tax=Paenibacillus sp. CGMCC 1.18879 TaxID=2834466 RepID=UPI001CA7B9C0|nr:hypothetical protein [Paenibacillus sp. CGMCC 1.18879]MBY9078928.1 hypothetical protein [Paenibacillus sp. CGMCC 1.18879]